MAKFFRNKRTDSIMNKKIKKYFFYAVGEIILVVIGILLAVGINNWNIEVNNSKQEAKILDQLLVEYTTNLEEIDNKISMRNMIVESVEKLFLYADYGFSETSIDSVGLYIHRTTYDPTFDPADGVTNELLNSGKFYLLQNEELKNQLTSWFRVVSELNEQEELTAKFVYERYLPYILENFDYRSIKKTKTIVDNQMNKLYSKGETRKLNIKREISRETIEEILADKGVQSYMLMVGSLNQAGNMKSIDTRDRILEILENIQSEIELKKS